MPDLILELETRVCRTRDVLDTEINDETVMMDIDQGRYYGLNQPATRIWSLLAEPVTIRDLCDRIEAEFEVSPEQCEREVVDFLRDLQGRGLLQVVTDETP